MATNNSITPEENKNADCEKHYKGKKIGMGILVVILGAILLFNALMPNIIHMRFIWPFVIILVGLKWIFFSSHSAKHCRNRCHKC